ncbi:MAG: HU family DNA-binding protein [Clostridia bacterium]|nr:HU family DNA-binding protein [Clostridia bacterium]
MNKTQLIDSIVLKTGIKKKDAEAVLSAAIESIVEALEDGEKVQISGLGSFEVKTRAKRLGRNPKTQETITIPASKYPAFSASKTLKDSVNK